MTRRRSKLSPRISAPSTWNNRFADGIDPVAREKARKDAMRKGANGLLWSPLPGPQTHAYETEADELYYGGAAGGGKTDLLLGLAAFEHERAFIFRRTYTQLEDMIDRSKAIIGSAGKFNYNNLSWRLPGQRLIRFAAIQHERDVDKWQGRARDLLAFDEITHFTRKQYITLSGWVRTSTVGQRTRIVATGNPPTDPEGEWVLERWAAWLDPQHPNPALPGELRWYAMVDDVEVERPDGSVFRHKNEDIKPMSRTFIPAYVEDNPYYMATDYKARLQSLPEPLRSMLLFGSHTAGGKDHPWQVIPTQWVRDAQARWLESPREWQEANRPYMADPERHGQMIPMPLSCLGVDVARGGSDFNSLSPRYGTWYARLKKIAGSDTPDADPVIQDILLYLTQGGYANIDGIGVGSSVVDGVRRMVGSARGRSIIFSEAAPGQDSNRVLTFANLRAYAWWHMRELLDPNSIFTREHGPIALPPDRRLLADLCAPRWSHRHNGVYIESKEEIVKRLKRSPDDGDAVVYASLTDLIYKGADYTNQYLPI